MLSLPNDISLACLEKVTDPRLKRRRRHQLVDILVLALSGFIPGCESWVDVELFGRSKQRWFEKFLELPHGIPSHDTFGRVFALLNPEELVGVLREFVQGMVGSLAQESIAIDGKTLTNSGNRKTGKAALHLVSAWATRHGVVLGQVATADHSNEITAIPRLLRLLDIQGAVVTIDAMGCQQAIARQIREQGADYVLAVKGNQGNVTASRRGPISLADGRGSSGDADHPGDGDRSRANGTTYREGDAGPARRPATLAGCPKHCPGGPHHPPGWQEGERGALLYQQLADRGPALGGGRPRPLGDREPTALVARCNFRRRSKPHPSRPCRRKRCPSSPAGTIDFEARHLVFQQSPLQTPQGRLGGQRLGALSEDFLGELNAIALLISGWAIRKALSQNDLRPRASPPHAVLQLGGLAQPAASPKSE